MERLDARDPKKRWERAAYLRDVEDQEPKELLYLGFSAYDLMRAGFDETELLGAGVADAEILRAREDIKAEQLKKRDRRSTHKNKASGSSKAPGSFKVVRRALSRGISRAESKVTPSETEAAMS